MSAPPATPAPPSLRRTSRKERAAIVVLVLLLVYGAIAYLLLPYEYARHHKRYPGLADVRKVTTTGDGHPGDPINVALVGDERQLKLTLLAAKYYPADPLTLKSCLEIADATVLKRPYNEAPVSSLYYYGRKQDLAFEFPVGNNPRERHHVRFWKAPQPDADGRPLWMGQTSFDRSVGFSHTTGQITHHIAPEIDAERDFLFDHLQASGNLQAREAVADFHVIRSGKNGGGDPWYSDGRLILGVIRPDVQ